MLFEVLKLLLAEKFFEPFKPFERSFSRTYKSEG